ncbi:MAG: class I SAM-dependent methyltransferase, partial [Oligoflexia bacterium]|nr:class I SAM-dependent methyltransferase [Oligoflexia bacterium]
SGFEVEAVDFSEVAIKKASELAESKKCGVDYKVQSMDFYLAPLQKYDSVVVIDYKCSPRLLDELKKGLVIGGTLLIEAYTMDYIRHRSDTDLEADECYKPYEFSRTIKGWNLLYYDEIGADSDYKVRAILSKPPY